jgi:hypothetical protein
MAHPKLGVAYPTLADPATDIRLLTIVADLTEAPQTDRVRISILTTSLEHTPSYHAISYTWGSPSEIEEITVVAGDGEEYMTVRKNCADVLRQVAHFKTTKYYWVDAICINQTDEYEKGVQVSMMDKIFDRAEYVLACIGTPHGDGQSSTYLLRGFDDYLDSNGQSTATFIRGTRDDCSQELAQCLRFSEQWLNQLSEADTVRFSKALDEIAGLPYFTRIWILQELFLARHLRIFYGSDELSLPTLLFWWQHLRPEWSFRSRDEDSPLLYKKLCSTGSGRTYIESYQQNHEEFFEERKGGSRLGAAHDDFLHKCALSITLNTPKHPICLRDVLDLCEEKSCTDPRDTVYGTLAFTDWPEARTFTLDGQPIGVPHSVLKPDYTKSSIDLAKELLPYFNDIGQMLQILKMLKVHPNDTSRSDETARRKLAGSSVRIESDQCVVSLAKQSAQKHVQVAGGCIKLTSKGPWRTEQLKRKNRGYSRIFNSNALLCGVASAGIRTGDWIFPTYCRYGIVLRQINATSRFYTVVGRVAWSQCAIPDDFPLTVFIFILGVDDVVLHLIQAEDLWDDWSHDTEPSETLQAALNLTFCAAPYSSFAVIPNDTRIWSEEDFKIRDRSDIITLKLLGDWRYRLLLMQGYS